MPEIPEERCPDTTRPVPRSRPRARSECRVRKRLNASSGVSEPGCHQNPGTGFRPKRSGVLNGTHVYLPLTASSGGSSTTVGRASSAGSTGLGSRVLCGSSDAVRLTVGLSMLIARSDRSEPPTESSTRDGAAASSRKRCTRPALRSSKRGTWVGSSVMTTVPEESIQL